MKIYQARDIGGSMYTYFGQKPGLLNGQYQRNGIARAAGFTFPIPLKPLQIAEITVNEDGTWSYEIEREDGYYMVRYPDKSSTVWRYKLGVWYYGGSEKQIAFMPDKYTISSVRIPDECII